MERQPPFGQHPDPSMQTPMEQPPANEEEFLLGTFIVNGFPVNKVRKGAQILYRLAGNVLAHNLTREQRAQLTAGIKQLHEQEMLRAAQMSRVRPSPHVVAGGQQHQHPHHQQRPNVFPRPLVPATHSMPGMGRPMPRQQAFAGRPVFPMMSPPQMYAAIPPQLRQQQILQQQQHQQLLQHQAFLKQQQQQMMKKASSGGVGVMSLRPQVPVAPPVPTISQNCKRRIHESLERDVAAVTNPDVLKPFSSLEDAVDRLLPYHVYQYREDDFEYDEDAFEKQANVNAIYLHRQARVVIDKSVELRKKLAEERPNVELEILCDRLLLREERENLKRIHAALVNKQKAIQQQQLQKQQVNDVTMEEEEDEDEEEDESLADEEEEDDDRNVEDDDEEDDSLADEEEDNQEEEDEQDEEEDDDDQMPRSISTESDVSSGD
eukprot:Partr_v1_DN27409_c3_g1_i1_m71687